MNVLTFQRILKTMSDFERAGSSDVPLHPQATLGLNMALVQHNPFCLLILMSDEIRCELRVFVCCLYWFDDVFPTHAYYLRLSGVTIIQELDPYTVCSSRK